MVSMEVYENSQHAMDILRLLARGEKEIEAGIGYELDDVLKEADGLLEATELLKFCLRPLLVASFLKPLPVSFATSLRRQ